MEKPEHFCPVFTAAVENCTVVPQKKKLKTELPYDPAIPLSDIYTPKELKAGSLRHICTTIFKAALFTGAKT